MVINYKMSEEIVGRKKHKENSEFIILWCCDIISESICYAGFRRKH